MTIDAKVPCNGCRECCKGDAIFLHPENGDDPRQYRCHPDRNPITGRTAWVLDRHPDTNWCVYLGPDGCTIHGRAPAICREFDCRVFFLRFTRVERKEMVRSGNVGRAVFDAGKAKLKETGAAERLEINNLVSSIKLQKSLSHLSRLMKRAPA